MLDYKIEQSGEVKVAVLTIDNGKANAISHGVIDAFHSALDRARSEASAVVIQGRSGLFSAGFDLTEFKKGPEAADALVGRGAELLLKIFSHPQPVVAACTGHAVAAGALILLASDTRIGTAGDFKIGLNETAIGMALPVFALELANARLARRYLTRAALQSEMYSPEIAQEAGFLDEVISGKDVPDRCLALAGQLGQLPAEAYRDNKIGTRESSIKRIADSLA